MTTHAKDKTRKEQLKSRGQGMNLVDVLQQRITFHVVGDGTIVKEPALGSPAEKLVIIVGDGTIIEEPALEPPMENLVNVVGDGIVEELALGPPMKILASQGGDDSVQQGKINLKNLWSSLTAEEQGVVNRATEKGIGPPEEILASKDKESIQRGSMQTLLHRRSLTTRS
jgi:hypothetical protein